MVIEDEKRGEGHTRSGRDRCWGHGRPLQAVSSEGAGCANNRGHSSQTSLLEAL